MFRLPLSLVSPAGQRGRLSIMVFHRVLAGPDPLFPDLPDAAGFEARMRWVRSWFNVVPLAAGIDLLYRGRVPARALAITFDDGYADNEEIAAPVLARLGLTATFFVSTGFLGSGCMWNDRIIEAIRACEYAEIDLSAIGLGRAPLAGIEAKRRAIASSLLAVKHLAPEHRQAATDRVVSLAGAVPSPALMMKPEQVRRLCKSGMAIGAHTVTHPILTRLGSDAARAEMEQGKAELEDIVGEPVGLFAYPNGVPGQDYGAEHARMARECGFSAALSTAWGAATMRSDRFQLPRFTPWDGTKLRYGARLVANLVRGREETA